MHGPSRLENDVLPEPLHPAVVHFPIVLAVFLPFVAALAMWRLHDGAPLRRWRVVAAMAVLLFAAAFVTMRTGHAEEERVEDVLASEEPLNAHEEAADLLVVVSGMVAALALVGFVPGLVGRGARWLTVIGAVAALGAAVRVGDLGGKLVYQHGAAAAYFVQPAQGSATPAAPDSAAEAEDEDR
jgi:uncharacterized membrane protein